MKPLIGILAFAVAFVGLAPLAAGQPQLLFRGGATMVDLYVTVTDEEGRLVPDLTEEDFTIFDNNTQQPIALFDKEIRPVAVVIMLDTSGSTIRSTNAMPLIVGGAQQFLNNMLPGDRARIGSFHDTVSIIPSQFIDDVYWLNRALVELPYGDKYAMTKLFDGIAASLDALQEVAGRKVVLVLTDGQDTASFTGWRALRTRAVAEEVMVYAIGLEVTYHDGYRWVHTRPDASLQELANETGGGYFQLDETDQLARTFRRVSEELHSQYVLAFEPPARDGKVHEVDVRVGRQQMTARARRSYVAPADAGQ